MPKQEAQTAFRPGARRPLRQDEGDSGADPVPPRPPARSDVVQRLTELLRQSRARDRLFAAPQQDDGAPATVVVAVSGGADSMALLHLLSLMRDEWSLKVVAAHLDHGLRRESAEDATFVGEMACRWNLPFETDRLPAAALKEEGNLEAAARQWRYSFLAQVAIDRQVDGQPVDVAVAHTANDQAETVLMNLVRGSGLRGLAGMRPVRPLTLQGRVVPGVRVVRPLLAVSRSEVLEYLRIHDIPWREDPTNQDRTFVRNRIRHDILPGLQEINPQIVASICRTATLLGDELKRSDHATQQALAATRKSGEGGRPASTERVPTPAEAGQPFGQADRQIFDLTAFRSLRESDQRSVLRAALRGLGRPLMGIGFDSVERLRESLCNDDQTGGPYTWVHDVMVTRIRNAFSLHRREALPFVPNHPFLDCVSRRKFPVRSVSVPGELETGGWVLRSAEVERGDLPGVLAARSTGSPVSGQGLGGQISPWEAYIDADAARELGLSAPRAGQRFEPLGLGGHGKALGDYFTDRKVPRFLRAGWPLLLDGDRVVWVGGHQIAHFARITDRSRRVYHFYWEVSNR